MARPIKLTDDIHERIAQLVRAGMFLKDAAAFSHVGVRTIYDWLERADVEEARIEAGETPDEDEQKYVEFSRALEHARAYANITDMNVIGQAASNDPAWAERRLKLRNPSMFRTEIDLQVRKTPEQVESERKQEIMRGAHRALRS